jgi:hypothetical protein
MGASPISDFYHIISPGENSTPDFHKGRKDRFIIPGTRGKMYKGGEFKLAIRRSWIGRGKYAS